MMNKAIDVDVIPVETACPICGHEYTAVFADHELAQLRADLQAAQERIAWLTSDIGESGLDAINRLIAACERSDIPQQYTPDLSIARDEILRQARQLEAAHLPDTIDMLKEIMDFVFSKEPCGYYCDEAIGHVDHKYTNWLRGIIGDLNMLAANPAPEAEPQP